MKWFSPLLLLTLYCFCFIAYADDTTHRSKSWNGVTLYGSLNNDKSLKYLLESQLRFVDVHNNFETVYLEAGLGHQTLPNFVFWFGFRLEAANNYQGDMAKGAALWQQFTSDIYKTPYINITTRTRLEEIQILGENGVFLLFQQRFGMEIPIDSAAKYAIACSETLYFQFNHPDWVTNKLLNQNRLFLGLKYQLDLKYILYFGYINQYQFNDPNVMSNIIMLHLNVN